MGAMKASLLKSPRPHCCRPEGLLPPPQALYVYIACREVASRSNTVLIYARNSTMSTRRRTRAAHAVTRNKVPKRTGGDLAHFCNHVPQCTSGRRSTSYAMG